MTVLFDHEPLTGRVRLFHDLGGDQYALETRVDVEPVIEANKDLARLQDNRWRDNSNLVARIPDVIYHQLRKTWREQGLSYEERQTAMAKFLNDPDNRLFRVKAGKL